MGPGREGDQARLQGPYSPHRKQRRGTGHMDLRGLLREARVPPGEGGEPHSREEVGGAEEEELREVRRKWPRGVQHCQSERDLSEDNSGLWRSSSLINIRISGCFVV